ncbi:MAG: hypothetical protein OXG72_08935 [Acidobacteria bacterium]|nr:hypothetical protein [Acidobacteriota bacterium]
MDALQQQLMTALRRLSEQSERERTQQAAQAEACQQQVATLRQQVERLAAQVTCLTERYRTLAETFRRPWS